MKFLDHDLGDGRGGNLTPVGEAAEGWRSEPNPKVKADAGQVVFAKGPLVYCLESEDVSFPVEKAMVAAMTPEEAETRVTATWRPDLLEGIHTLTVPGQVDGKELDLTLVPWFVRASRSDNARWLVYLPQEGR